MIEAAGSLCNLAATGLGFSLGGMTALAVVMVVVGIIVVRRGRRARTPRTGITVALLLCLGVGLGIGTAPSAAHADVSQCAGNNTISVAQTSPISNLRPGGGAQRISGVSTNISSQSVVIAAIVVSISGVTTAPGVVGSCPASDFVITGARMPVGVTLAPGASTPFGGATIELLNGPGNQDACKGATVQLLYQSS